MADRTTHRTQTPTPERKAETDAGEDAARHGTGPGPRSDPPRTFAVNTDGEVRAGPGDAGRQDTPERLPRATDRAPQSIRRLMIVLGIAAAVTVLVYLVAL